MNADFRRAWRFYFRTDTIWKDDSLTTWLKNYRDSYERATGIAMSYRDSFERATGIAMSYQDSYERATRIAMSYRDSYERATGLKRWKTNGQLNRNLEIFAKDWRQRHTAGFRRNLFIHNQKKIVLEIKRSRRNDFH